jgi:hypothetical protein
MTTGLARDKLIKVDNLPGTTFVTCFKKADGVDLCLTPIYSYGLRSQTHAKFEAQLGRSWDGSLIDYNLESRAPLSTSGYLPL